MMAYGQKIKQARTEKDMSLEALGKKIGSHKGYISGIENSKVNPPSWQVTRRLCQVLRLNEEEMQILGWAEKAPLVVRDFVGEIVKAALTNFKTAH